MAPVSQGPLRLLFALLLGLTLAATLWQLLPSPAAAAELQVSEVRLEPCPASDAASQSGMRRPSGASCVALRGVVVNPGKLPVVDTDLFARVLDASGEPVLPNRTRLGSIGDVPPGRSNFAVRLSVPAGSPGPFQVGQVRARGFRSPVRSRGEADSERLPLEQELASG
jgi:hypothetical protein